MMANKYRTTMIVLLILFAFFAAMQYYELSKTRAETVKNAQIEQLNIQFNFNPSTETTKEMALDALMQAEANGNELIAANLTKFYITDILLTAKKYYVGEDLNNLNIDITKREDGDKKNYLTSLLEEMKKVPSGTLLKTNYDESLRNSQLIAFKKKQAYLIVDAISLLEEKENSYKNMRLDTTEVNDIIKNAKTQFADERYSEAAILLVDADSKLDAQLDESKRKQSLIVVGKTFLLAYWPQILLVLVIIVISAPYVFAKSRKKAAKKKISKLTREMEDTVGLIKEAQNECFNKKSMSLETYNALEGKYKSRISEIKRKIPVLEAIAKGADFKEEKSKKKDRGILQIEDEK